MVKDQNSGKDLNDMLDNTKDHKTEFTDDSER
jgi:hypothetical protein